MGIELGSSQSDGSLLGPKQTEHTLNQSTIGIMAMLYGHRQHNGELYMRLNGRESEIAKHTQALDLA